MEAIGQYRIDKRLGSGGMGIVYAVTHSTLRDRYAIKTLHEEFREDAGFLERFAREARCMRNLGTHPHILAVDDFHSNDGGVAWMRMSLIDGAVSAGGSGERRITLADRMVEEKEFEISEGHQIIDQLSAAVSFSHEKGVLQK